jgi:hypothetical protein
MPPGPAEVVNPTPLRPGELVDPATLPRLKARWEAPAGGPGISRMAFSSDGRWLAAAAYGRKELAVIDPTSGLAVRTFAGHTDMPIGVAPLPGGQFVSLARNADEALVWNPATGRESRRFGTMRISREAEPFVYTSLDGRYFLSGGTESDNWQPAPPTRGGVMVKNVQTGWTLATPMRWGVGRVTSDNARLVIAEDKTAVIRQYGLPDGKETRVKAEGDIEPPLTIAISPDGRQVVYLGNADRPDLKQYHVYDTATGRRVRTIPLRPTAGFRTGFSPNGRWLILVHASGDPARGNEVVFVDTATWTPVAVAAAGNTRGAQWDHGHRFSPDGSVLAVPKANGGLIAFDVPSDVAAARQLGTRP